MSPQRQSLPLWKNRLLFQLLIHVHFQIARDPPRCQLVYFERSASIFWHKRARPLVEEKQVTQVFTFDFKGILNKGTTLIMTALFLL